MIFKNLKITLTLLFLSICILPINVLAYSDKILVGGQNIGITVESKGVIIVGTYEVNGRQIAIDAGLKAGDIITAINDTPIKNISNMIDIISHSETESIKVEYLHNQKEKTTNLEVILSDNVYKTGLYVKDSVTGIGTLTFIDPTTKLFGALGHEILESNTGIMLEVKDGKIYDSSVTSIDRSSSGVAGSKNATLNNNKIKGTIKENTESGIFGTYSDTLTDKTLYKVGNYENIELGKAQILTVIDGNDVKKYNINILKINNNQDNKTKNILFEIIDQELLSKTGGVIQGMSGSPIIQDNYIIGAVTHVIVDNPAKGYGILITNMLEEAEN